MKKFWAKLVALVKSFFASAFVEKVTNVLIAIIEQVGKETFEAIRTKVIEVGSQPISGEEKMKRVFDYVVGLKTGLKESAIRALIENIVQDIKAVQ